MTELSYCGAQLRRHDNDRYLTCMFAPADRREHLFALYAFNLEIAKTAEVVSEAMLGEIRLQWWRESIEAIYAGTPRKHEVVTPLSAAIRAAPLPRAAFERLIEARSRDLAEEPPASLEALEAYAEASSGELVGLALAVLGVEGEAARAAGRHVGIAWALTGLARAVPFHARQHRCYLPADLIAAKGTSLDELYALRPSAALAAVVREVALSAGRHLAEARERRREVPKAALPALLPAVLADRHLADLRRCGHDPFHLRLQRPAPGRIWRLAWAHLRGRY